MQAAVKHNTGMPACKLSAAGLACRRGERLLFRRLSLDLRAGDALHVEGVNGIGKSSLLRIVAGLLTPFAGTLETIGDIALLDERPALDPDMPLGKSLSFWQAVDGGGDPSDAFARLGLTDLLDVPVRYLSTGQRKRASLASLLNRNAPIWLLDEPLNGLDSVAHDTVLRLIEEHCERGGICMIASHQTAKVTGLKTLDLADFTVGDAP